MPNKTIYVKSANLGLFDLVKRYCVLRGYSGISDYFLDLAKKDMTANVDRLPGLISDFKSDIRKLGADLP